MTLSPDISSLIHQPRTAATAERQPSGDYLIRWAPPATVVHVYAGASPQTIDRRAPLSATPLDSQAVLVSGPAGVARPYFEVVFEDGPAEGQSTVVAERTVRLEGGVNFRDIGGYVGLDGRRVRWGRVYRSGTLADLSDSGVATLAALDIRIACDLRTDNEAAEFPDRLPPTTTGWHTPMGGTVSRTRRLLLLLLKRNRLREVLQEAYTHVMIDQNGRIFGALFRELADPDHLPLLIHCTAGKDRTGVAVALLLASLGVDDETIAADYSLSNAYHELFLGQMAADVQALRRLGLRDEQLRAFFLAEPETILSALAYVRGRYGSVRDYLSRMGGVTPDVLARVQQNLLT